MKHTKHNIMVVLIFVLLIWKFEYCYSNNDAASCVEGERIALLQFKESLIDISNRLSSWTGLDCCKWEGISCSSTTGHVLKLDLHNPATSPDDIEDYWLHRGLPSKFSNNSLRGEINHSLINLTHLNYLDLSLNNFSGIRIPEFFGSFKNLRYLNISSSSFVGNIPTHLGNLSSLEYLHLRDDLATDNLDWLASLSSLKSLEMPGISIRHSEDWLRTINKLVSLSSLNLAYCHINTTSPLSHVNSTSLISLDLNDNSLDSAILPWLSNLTRLEHLNLHYNSFNSSMLENFEPIASLNALDLSTNTFTGTLVPLCKLHNLVFVDLNSNNFQGSIPNCLGNLTSLTSLDLSENSFTGSIPINTIGSLCRLQVLDFSWNKLTNSIAVLPDCLIDSLRYLGLGYNNFIGQLPTQLYKYKNMELLSLSSNYFSGPIIESLGNLSMLHSLDISYNKFSGSLPSSLGELSNLRALDISNNSFVGVFSEFHFSKLSNLKDLDISRNLFVFNVSSNWVPPFQLDEIAMESMKIGPHFPHWLRTQRNVETLFMSNASISSAIPGWFGKFFWNCDALDLSENHISGELPLELLVEGYMKANIRYLSLSKNYLSGGIPKWLCSLKYLEILVLSTNKLYGEIPSCLGKLQTLKILDLGNNNLSGLIPNSLGSLQELYSLHLQNNKLEGKLPSSMQNLTSLKILDLSENEFMDVIPPWIGENLLSLKYLIFYTNTFYGDIPLQLCQLHDLQLLNLANNNISGYIPWCIGNLTGMVFDDNNPSHYEYEFSYGDNYEDEIVQVIKGLALQYTKNLQFLRSIDLSGNHIVGKIPIEIMSLHALENLNVSRNNLSGTIPESIGYLNKIESLDLSRNKLSGPIPPSLSSLNFLSHLNLSFNYLYGRIPTGSQLQTLNDPSIYMGNAGLCGAPLSKGCPGDVPSFANQSTITCSNDDHEFFMWFYAGMGPGFFVGFIGVLSILVFTRSWSYAYFKFLEKTYDKVLDHFS